MTEINQSIPQETLNIVCGILKPYLPEVTSDNITSYFNQTKNKKVDRVLMNTKETLEYLGISYMTLRRAVKANELKCIKINPNKSGRVIFELAELNRWIDSKVC